MVFAKTEETITKVKKQEKTLDKTKQIEYNQIVNNEKSSEKHGATLARGHKQKEQHVSYSQQATANKLQPTSQSQQATA